MKGDSPMKKIAYVGIDYHMNVVAIAVIIEGEKEFYDTIRLKNSNKLIAKYLKKLSHQFTGSSITKTGNKRCRTQLIEAVMHHRGYFFMRVIVTLWNHDYIRCPIGYVPIFY